MSAGLMAELRQAAKNAGVTYPENHICSRAADRIASLEAPLAGARAMSDGHREHAQSAIESCAALKCSLSHAEAALATIKTMVCGDRFPKWGDHDAVTASRMTIADLADASLSSSKQKDGE